ncbi:MAG TPA: glycosyltransferase family 2 protein [Pyrinomonadaceae bacterium]
MKFSVAMCTYNGARFLREQLDSIAAQTRPPDELVVCDDRSTDGTTDLVAAFAAAARFPVRLHVNTENLGSTKNFDRAVSLCTGDLIALADQDDVWLPRKLELSEGALAASPRAGLVFTDAEVVDERLAPLGFTLWQRINFSEEEKALIRRGRGFDVLLEHNVVTGATMAFRAELRDLVLPIPTEGRLIHDGWIALLAAAVSDLAFVELPLVQYRQHEAQQLGAVKGGEFEHRRATFAEVLEAAQATRGADYLRELNWLEPFCARLAEQGGAYRSRAGVVRLNGRLTHLRARASLPRGRLARVPIVLRELLTMRYHRHSRGVLSFAKDLFN